MELSYLELEAQKEGLYMGNEFIVTSDYSGYVYVGNAYGNFEDQSGKIMPFANIFVLSPVSSYESNDYHATGFKAEKLKCSSHDVWKDLQIGDRVKLYFDDKKRVVLAVAE